jgi:hypothetical protein
MLAPTRELAANLNRRARAYRLNRSPAGREVRLADGNQASVGDVIITRTNDRRLRLAATDWVKNGDRWTITHVSKHGDLGVRHDRSRLAVRLPAEAAKRAANAVALGRTQVLTTTDGARAHQVHPERG